MGLFKNQRRDPATGQPFRQAVAGRSPDACPVCDRKHGSGQCRKGKSPTALPKRCETCGNTAKAGATLCRPCAKTKNGTTSRAKPKGVDKGKDASVPADSKPTKKVFGWSEASTIHVRGVAKNRWRRVYTGPAFKRDDTHGR